MYLSYSIHLHVFEELSNDSSVYLDKCFLSILFIFLFLIFWLFFLIQAQVQEDKGFNIKHLIGYKGSNEGGTYFSSWSTFCTFCICTCSRIAQCQWWRGSPESQSRQERPPLLSSPCSLWMDLIQLALPFKKFNTDPPHSSRESNSTRYFISATNYNLS